METTKQFTEILITELWRRTQKYFAAGQATEDTYEKIKYLNLQLEVLSLLNFIKSVNSN